MPSERDRRYFIEMLELTKHFNQHYEGPQRSQIPKDFILSQLGQTLIKDEEDEKVIINEILSKIEEEVVERISYMSKYRPPSQ